MSAYRNEQDVLLTTKEKNVLKLVAEANTNKEIAVALGISPSTVKRHMENILSKLQLRNRIEAAVYALSMKACPLALRAKDCPLGTWQNGRETKEAEWAIWPIDKDVGNGVKAVKNGWRKA